VKCRIWGVRQRDLCLFWLGIARGCRYMAFRGMVSMGAVIFGGEFCAGQDKALFSFLTQAM
jgi:hypothetical protein